MSSNKPFPSSDLDVFKENSLILDNFVNSQENEYPDRFARKRPTITGIIKEAFNVRTDISNMNETLIGQSRWDAVPKNTSLSLGGDNGALNKQAQALFNRTEMLKVQAREALRRTYQEVGLNLVEGSFEEGGTLETITDVLLEEKTGHCYSWSGSFPKVVAKGTSPTSEIEFVDKKFFINKFRLNPRSISEAIKNTYVTGEILTTVSYYSEEEVTALGLANNPGGGARYLVRESSGESIDQVKYHKTSAGLILELLDIPDSRNAGIVGNYIDHNNRGVDNFERIFSLDKLNKKIGNSNNFHGGNFYLSKPGLVFNNDTKGNGKESTRFFVNHDEGDQTASCVVFARDVTIKDLSFNPASTDSNKIFIANKFSSVFTPSFLYQSKLFGPKMSGNNTLVDVIAKGFNRGLTGTSGNGKLIIVRSEFWGAIWGVSLYNISDITFNNVRVIGGNNGGLALPSCKNVSITDVIVYNPDGTGINTGGSNASGFNAENINITSCGIYARDCINLENGCFSANIVGYKINVITSVPQNGVGIGVFSRVADNGGYVGNINVGPGLIEGSGGGSGEYSYAVRIGYEGSHPTAQPIRNISVTGVVALGCRVGCETVAPTNASVIGFKAGNNNFNSSIIGYSLAGEHQDGSITGGECIYSGDTTISNTRGVNFNILRRFVIDGLKIQGYAEHYRQLGACPDSLVNNPTGIKGRDSANFTEFNNQSGTGPVQIKRTA